MLEVLLDIGTFLALVGTLPQAYLIYKRRVILQDLSLVSQLVLIVALGLLAIYAFFNEAWLACGTFVIQFIWSGFKTIWIFKASSRLRSKL